MEKPAINQVKALELIRQGADLSTYQVEFDPVKIEALDAILLGKNGIEVPHDLIYYKEEEIGSEDDPNMSAEDLSGRRLLRVLQAEIPLEEEIHEWLKKEGIDADRLLANLLRNFYENRQFLSRE